MEPVTKTRMKLITRLILLPVTIPLGLVWYGLSAVPDLIKGLRNLPEGVRSQWTRGY